MSFHRKQYTAGRKKKTKQKKHKQTKNNGGVFIQFTLSLAKSSHKQDLANIPKRDKMFTNLDLRVTFRGINYIDQ